MSHAAWDAGLEALGDGPLVPGFYTKSPKMVMNSSTGIIYDPVLLNLFLYFSRLFFGGGILVETLNDNFL